ncbi:hypothetical protein F441_00263, partial [Phytophthora nicotianae CJ01A1]
WESGQASGRDNISRYDGHTRGSSRPRRTSWSTSLSTIQRSLPAASTIGGGGLVDSGLRDPAFSRGAEKSGTVERLTIDQYRLMRREVDQVRDDALKT